MHVRNRERANECLGGFFDRQTIPDSFRFDEGFPLVPWPGDRHAPVHDQSARLWTGRGPATGTTQHAVLTCRPLFLVCFANREWLSGPALFEGCQRNDLCFLSLTTCLYGLIRTVIHMASVVSTATSSGRPSPPGLAAWLARQTPLSPSQGDGHFIRTWNGAADSRPSH